MRFLHTMLRVSDLDRALAFFVNGLGLRETRRRNSEKPAASRLSIWPRRKTRRRKSN